MIVGSQQFGPGTFNRHLVALAHKKKSRKKALIIGLTLTSMVDMFSLLVIFLLQTFSASPEILVMAKGLELPAAHTGTELKDAPILSVTPENIYLDQKLIGTTDRLLREPTPLMERLSELRVVWQKSHPKETFPGEISLQAHKDLPSTVVSKVMGMLPSQSYGSVRLAVISGGTTGGP